MHPFRCASLLPIPPPRMQACCLWWGQSCQFAVGFFAEQLPGRPWRGTWHLVRCTEEDLPVIFTIFVVSAQGAHHSWDATCDVFCTVTEQDKNCPESLQWR